MVNIYVTAGLGFFFLNSMLHVFCSKGRNLTKALILPSIILCGLLVNIRLPAVLIVAACLSWLGDVLLEKEGIRWFTAGGLAFMASHLLYGLTYISRIDISPAKSLIIIPVALVYIAVSVITVRNVKDNSPERTSGLFLIYLFTNAFMNIMALLLYLSVMNFTGMMIYIGAVLFFISDNLLFYECFHKNKPNYFVSCISTYITGEFLIFVGSALLK